MSLDALSKTLPSYARDLGINLASLAEETVLNEQQKWGCFVACAYAVGGPTLIRFVNAAAKSAGLSPEAANAAKGSAAIMGMNNVYYRSLHLISNPEYRSMPAKLKMNMLVNPGVPKCDFELWSTAVSAINGCGMCLDAHEKELKTHCVSGRQIQAALRIAAVLNAIGRVLAAEEQPARELA